MGSKNSAPTPPDYTPLIKASIDQANKNFGLQQQQFDWAKQQYANNLPLVQAATKAATDAQTQANTNAANQEKFYLDNYQPLEKSFIDQAQSYSTPERQALEMGKAEATVAQNFDQARTAAQKNLESYGVDPTSTRYAALDMGSRVQQAAAAAAAGNTARANTELTGLNLENAAINTGRGYASSVNSSLATGTQAGQSAVGSTLANTNSGANTMGTATQYAALGAGDIGSATSAMNAGYNNALAQYNANQQSSSGIGSLIGAGLGLLGNSTNSAGASGIFALANGGQVPGAAIPSGVTPGGNVPAHASPSGGQAVDDVPARLTAGEFVVPKDVMSWKGEEFFQNLIKKSRMQQQEAPAKPRMAIAPNVQPTFASRPAGALPVG